MVLVYQAADDQWVVLSNGIKIYFAINNESEARNMADKITFAEKAQDISTRLAILVDEGTNLRTVYFDRVYNTGGTAIIDADIVSLGITAANISSFITLVEQLQNFVDFLTVTEADYDTTLNAMRTDV